MVSCILCAKTTISEYYKDKKHHFLVCSTCHTVFRHPETFISFQAEKDRYLSHHNDVTDTGYQKSVKSLVEAVSANFSTTAVGLDFGAGTGPVAATLLREKGYSIVLYDPFFYPNQDVLGNKYDFIICNEVIEHFHHPLKEFKLLKSLLKPEGMLFCMTMLWNGTTEIFKNWWYKNDSTHTLFYHKTNLKFIQKTCNFKSVFLKGNLIILK